MKSIDCSFFRAGSLFVNIFAVVFPILLSAKFETKKIAEFSLSADKQKDGFVIGGMSDLVYSADEKKLYVISDDRGQEGEPRFFVFDVVVSDKNLAKDKNAKSIQLNHIKTVAINFKTSYAEGKKSEVHSDFEGIAILPWGNLLISTEGDNNHKPRIAPSLMDVKKDGTYIRSYEVPTELIPEASGKQSKGIRNNRGFEALSKSLFEERWLIGTEGKLVQDKSSDFIRVLEYSMPEAWKIQYSREWHYKMTESEKAKEEKGKDGKAKEEKGKATLGVSAICWWKKDRALFVERDFSFNKLKFENKIVEVEIPAPASGNSVKNVVSVNGLKVTDQVPFSQVYADEAFNLEGLAIGPEIEPGWTTLFAVSDNNFNRLTDNKIIVFLLRRQD